MQLLDLPGWIEHLRRTAAPGTTAEGSLGLGALEPAFRVAAGVDASLPADAAASEPRGETALWWALVDNSIDVDALLADQADGPLLSRSLHRTLEVWTECELCALHALWKLARRRDRPDWRERVTVARDWHLENTQPDNFTNRPWALHAFVLGGTPESDLYAQTLLHNTLATGRVMEPLSAWILVDAAWELEVESELA